MFTYSSDSYTQWSSFTNKYTLWVLVSLDETDSIVESMELWANFHHGECVCCQMNPSWVFGESEHSFSGKKTIGSGPVPKWAWTVWQQIVSHSLNIEFPSVWAVSLDQIALEQASPFGALNFMFEVSNNGWESSVEIEVLQCLNVSSDFSSSFKVVLIHRAWSYTKVTSGLV